MSIGSPDGFFQISFSLFKTFVELAFLRVVQTLRFFVFNIFPG